MSLDIPIEESKLLSKAITKCTPVKENVHFEKFALIPSEVDSNLNQAENPSILSIDNLDPSPSSFYECKEHNCTSINQNYLQKVKSCIVDANECDCCENSSKKINPLQKHLYPKVVVNISSELSDLDSDEEDFNLRKYHKSDSGQGSSVETSSLKSNSAVESLCINTNDKENNYLVNENFDGNFVDNLRDIDLSTEDKLTVLKNNVGPRGSLPTTQQLKDSSFTDIPLDGTSNSTSPIRPLNTFAPKKLSSPQHSENVLQKEFKAPVVTDHHPKTRFLSGANQKTWKIFGKVAIPISKNLSLPGSPTTKKKDGFAPSTTALIFENRPSNLPRKSAKEEQKHREMYEEMVNAARKKEQKEKVNENKKIKEMRKMEDQLSNSVKVWRTDIIPDWDNCHNSRKVRELWWHGLPSSVRGEIWNLAIGNQLNMTEELFEIFLSDAKERMKNLSISNPVASVHNCESSLVVSKENTVGLIALDVSRTFPSLCIFQKGGPYHEPLKHLLSAYTCHRPDVGYVQGMSFLAAMLLLNMDLPQAFIFFTNLLNRPCQMAFFMVDQPMMDAYYRTFDVLLDEQIPRLHLHFKQECLSHDIYLIDWIFTLFSKSLPLDTACRVWDLFCRDGEEFLFRTALVHPPSRRRNALTGGILLMYEDVLLEMEFFRLAQYLTKLSNTITADTLFQFIEKINIPKNKFQNTLGNFKMLAKSNPPPT